MPITSVAANTAGKNEVDLGQSLAFRNVHFTNGRDTVLKTVLNEHLTLHKSRIIQIRQVEEALIAGELYIIKHGAHAVRQVV